MTAAALPVHRPLLACRVRQAMLRKSHCTCPGCGKLTQPGPRRVITCKGGLIIGHARSYFVHRFQTSEHEFEPTLSSTARMACAMRDGVWCCRSNHFSDAGLQSPAHLDGSLQCQWHQARCGARKQDGRAGENARRRSTLRLLCPSAARAGSTLCCARYHLADCGAGAPCLLHC